MSPENSDWLAEENPLEMIHSELRKKALKEIEESGIAAKFNSTPTKVLHAAIASAIGALQVPLDPRRSDESIHSQESSQNDLAASCITAGGVDEKTADEIVAALILKLGLISRTRQ